MIEIARRKNSEPSIQYHVMDASQMSFLDKAFDAIFDFGIIHHIPSWKDCISEINRVLRDDGEVILEELSKDSFITLPGRIWRRQLDHPYDQMFSKAEFLEGLAAAGFVLHGYSESYPLRLFKHFSLVAKKSITHGETVHRIGAKSGSR
jgi:ubiquinone/menaquinone biosynthesis C-methylase UbiE